ncbi:hypothetical protein [Gimesia sp.]|uniref:hypothetical protein n=1 Tax=Gimesia sp. TaxID=2024833 RepID=UPI003A8CD4E1
MSWKEAVFLLEMPQLVMSHRIDVDRKKQFAREMYRVLKLKPENHHYFQTYDEIRHYFPFYED